MKNSAIKAMYEKQYPDAIIEVRFVATMPTDTNTIEYEYEVEIVGGDRAFSETCFVRSTNFKRII